MVLSKEHSLEEKVLFLGKRHDIDRLLTQYDISLLNSMTAGIPCSILKAMTLGIVKV
jgi:glycosyltransferase involved in cell wall biosynthesis